VTPGLIDVHSHLGVYPSPSISATSDGNEATSPVTSRVWAEHSVWPQDPGFPRALAGGVTTVHVLPGSANLIGGRGVTLKNVPSRTVQGMKFPGAPYTLKMACGENPKRVYGRRNQAPSTRMGNVAGYRQAFLDAAEYKRNRDRAAAAGGNGGDREGGRERGRDLGMETLVGVLDGEILVQMHCYRAEEMAVILDMAREMGFEVTAFHHAVEAYKIADLLAEEGVCGAMWADWWGFKLEAFDGVRENIALVDAAGGCAIVHSDSERGIQRLNQEAAKAMAAGNRAGLDVTRAEAIRWVTANPAKAIGIAEKTGTLEAGKAADVVIWSGDPFSVYAHADRVYLDGAAVYDRSDPALQPVTDFELGILPAGGAE
jgi:imidazolonepropionase-like amidohydrolase